MNSMIQSTMRRSCAVLCIAMVATCSQASARTPRSRVQHGVIEMIDRVARTLRIQSDGQANPLTLVWNSRTRFIESGRFVSAAELRQGTPVAVWYLTPLFGERFATKIVNERGLVRPVRPSH
jgi:hypothetical protein